MSAPHYNPPPPYRWRAGLVLEYIGGPRDGQRCEMHGNGKEALIFLDTPQPVEALEAYNPVAFTRRMGVYEVQLYGHGHGPNKPVDWFYALKWAGER